MTLVVDNQWRTTSDTIQYFDKMSQLVSRRIALSPLNCICKYVSSAKDSMPRMSSLVK